MNLESYNNHDTARTVLASKNRAAVLTKHAKRARSNISLKKVAMVALVAVMLLGLYVTAPQHKFEECRGTDVPSHCVD